MRSRMRTGGLQDYGFAVEAESDRGLRMGKPKPKPKPKPSVVGVATEEFRMRSRMRTGGLQDYGFAVEAESDRGLRMGKPKPKPKPKASVVGVATEESRMRSRSRMRTGGLQDYGSNVAAESEVQITDGLQQIRDSLSRRKRIRIPEYC